ncbi:YlbF family regulator [Weissella ceti]|uniref:UPF0342 protein OIT44_03270 n=1 Tax=Weissella ceti TaxID=759620 RepID=A0ABT3E3V5_9LACO|nr:YlbF family regulator [Weissella ceti]MCW0953093.1 YlbF family regulator [Weissella ceti]QVK11636.1 YlbF family regulator [Weissella ceti]
MVNIFDSVNAVEKDLRETPQYKNLNEALKAVRANEEASAIFTRFQEAQVAINSSMQTGQQPEEAQIMEWQAVAKEMEMVDELKTLMETEQAMNQLLMQINNAITKPIAELYQG